MKWFFSRMVSCLVTDVFLWLLNWIMSMTRILSFGKSGIMTRFRDFLVIYYRILRISMGYTFWLPAVSERWLLVVSCSKIWTFGGAVNLLAFSEVVCRRILPLLELLPLLPIAEAESLGFYAWGLAFTDRDLYVGLIGGLMSLEFSFLRRLDFGLTLCRRRVFFFAASILKYFFSYTNIICPTMYEHHCIAGIFAICFRGILKFCEGLRRLHTLYFSGNELRCNHIHSN